MWIGFVLYKVGVMFMSVLNLPRKQRMKQRWTMLVGIIPGPSEPKLHINDFLRPLVDDLELLWNGIEVVLADGSIKAVKAALVCVSCDLPAQHLERFCSFWVTKQILVVASANFKLRENREHMEHQAK